MDFPALTALELASAGRALYGAHWRSELAAALGLPDDALIRAVEAGIVEAPSNWRGRLIAIAQDVALRAMEVANDLLWRQAEPQADACVAAPRGAFLA